MLRLRARVRTFGIGTALAIASLGIVAPVPASANGLWNIQVGAGDEQNLNAINRFYPNDITVHPGDTVRFTWAGFHTVTFNPQPNLWLFDYFGPGGASSLDSPTTFVNLPAFAFGPTTDLTVGSKLPDGSYPFWCQLHQFMHGVIRVTRGALPKTDGDYQTLAHSQIAADSAASARLDAKLSRQAAEKDGEALAGAGNRTIEFAKFYPSQITVKAGDELTFTDADLHEPHTVTFGPVQGDPADPATGTFPSGPGNPNAFDGKSAINSGLLFHQSQYDYWNVKVSPIANARPRTEFSLTFTTPGKYNFYCFVHGRLLPDGSVVGMSGSITVLPKEKDNHS